MKFYRHDVRWDEMEAEDCEAEDGEWATRDDAEQAAKERDEFERKCKELCFAYGQSLIELAQVKRDAVEMARLARREIVRRCSGRIGWVYEEDPGIQRSQATIERYEGVMENG